MQRHFCELCGLPTDPDDVSCSLCPSRSPAELIELAHNRLAYWKRLVIAAAIDNGGQTVLSPLQLLHSKDRRIEISVNRQHDTTITLVR